MTPEQVTAVVGEVTRLTLPNKRSSEGTAPTEISIGYTNDCGRTQHTGIQVLNACPNVTKGIVQWAAEQAFYVSVSVRDGKLLIS